MTIEHRIASMLSEEVEAHAAAITHQAECAYYDIAANCESPLERLLLVPLMFIKPQCIAGRYEGPGDREFEARLFAQYPVGPRRLDFAYVVTPMREDWEIRIGVECDGHEFHASAEQRANDNARAVEIMREDGFNILRFTGAQINRDPKRCAQDVADTVDGIYANHVFAHVNRTKGKAYVGPVGPLLMDVARKAGDGA